MEVYKRLVTASVDVLKANEFIQKLNNTIKKKDAEIEHLKQASSNMDHLTPVSLFHVYYDVLFKGSVAIFLLRKSKIDRLDN